MRESKFYDSDTCRGNAKRKKKEYRLNPQNRPWAGTITPEGERLPRLSPLGDVEAWIDPAEIYVATDAMKWVQSQYPDPPLILWVSNNEPPDLRWHQLETRSKRYLDLYGKGRSEEFKRKVAGDGWMERYGVMFDAMRKALINETWSRNVRFVGYGAFGPSHFGRWDGWLEYSLITSERIDPDWYVWQGASPSYYTHNWNDNRDHWVFSTQVQSMNWVFMLHRALDATPNFWFEMSIWDGNEIGAWLEGVGLARQRSEQLAERSSRKLASEQLAYIKEHPELLRKSKTLQYMVEGQTFPPERTLGWVQYGMWLLRPRVVREFRGHATPLAPVKPYWLQTVKAVDRVYEHPTLKAFWRHGELVSNPSHPHPYQTAIPEAYRELDRWYLLDTSLDPKRPWNYKTNLPVFSLALIKAHEEHYRWLVYAHSPLKNRKDVKILLPGFGEITIDVPRSGGFYLVDQKTAEVMKIL